MAPATAPLATAIIPAHAPDSRQPPTRVRRWLQRFAEPVILVPILACFTVVTLLLATEKIIRVERDEARRAAQTSTDDLLDTYEAQVVRVLRDADHTLKALQDAYQRDGDGAIALQHLAQRDLLPPSLVYRVSIVNTMGEVVATTGPSDTTSQMPARIALPNVADTLMDGRLVWSENAWWLQFNRRLKSPSGTEAGVALVAVDASLFVSGYETSKLGDHGLLVLLGRDGVVRVRRTGSRTFMGERIDYDLVMGDEAGDQGDPALVRDPWDGVRRYRSARALFGMPLAVAVGLSEEEALAPALGRARTYRWRTTAASTAVLLAFLWIWYTSRSLTAVRRREQAERLRHANRVEHLAFHDDLTGLPNRAFLTHALDAQIAGTSTVSAPFALLFLDLDGFKQVNDTQGHDTGDALLREVAGRLSATVRPQDTVARMGGDEFMVLMPDITSATLVTETAQSVLATLADPFLMLGERCAVTVSVGISMFPGDGTDQQTLQKHADIALYAAKDQGKNCFCFFTTAMRIAAQARTDLETQLRAAITREEFELYYQARRDLQSGEVTGMEALVRWNHPSLGTMGPGHFLPLAEETGLILPLGRWVLRTACRQHQTWITLGLPSIPIAVNLSARQFFDPMLVDEVAQCLEEFSISPSALELEISESVLANDTDKTVPVLERLKGMGVRITVDNFGSAFSALSALGQLPIDTIKIDRRFLRDTAADHTDLNVINGILAMGRVLSPSIVAHGVDTREQVEFLRANASTYIKSFHFGMPFRADDLPAVLQAEAEVLRR